MKGIRLTPVDSLFFRDGRAYNMGEPSVNSLVPRFPPSSRTLVGAIRAAWARAMGWQKGPWDDSLRHRLGDGDNLSPLRFHGPFLMQEQRSLFALPAHIMGGKAEGQSPSSVVALAPGSEALHSDLDVRTHFPASASLPENAQPLYDQGLWLTSTGLGKILAGLVPETDDWIPQGCLWRSELRTGIQRDASSRTAQPGFLYTASHVRLNDNVAVVMGIDNLPQDGKLLAQIASCLHPLGGEGRMCQMEILEGSDMPVLPPMPSLSIRRGRVRYSVILLQPTATSRPPQPQEENYAGLPGIVVSACLPKPVLVGGWDSVTRRPLPLRPHLAPGSILFLEAEAGRLDAIQRLHGASVGANGDWGFGLTVIGQWPQASTREQP